MRLQLGDDVRTKDGRDAGKIDKLILDPESGEIRAVVLRKGRLFPDDVEVAPDLLTAEADGTVRLSRDADQLDELPRFYEANYTTTPPAGSRSAYPYPLGGVVWPTGGIGSYPVVGGLPLTSLPPVETAGLDAATRREIDADLLQQDLQNAVIDEGSDVVSRDGEKIGEVQTVSFDPASGRPVSFVVRKGFLFTDDLELPADTVAAVDDGIVYLELDQREVQARFRRPEP